MNDALHLPPRWSQVRVLILGWLLVIPIRIFLFPEGGAGAWVCTGIFALLTLVLLVQCIRGLSRRDTERRRMLILVVVGIAAFVYRGLVQTGPTAPIAAVLAFICGAWLLVVIAGELARETLRS